jgi:hypothetical protein
LAKVGSSGAAAAAAYAEADESGSSAVMNG